VQAAAIGTVTGLHLPCGTATPLRRPPKSFTFGQATDAPPLPFVRRLPDLLPDRARAIDIGTGNGRNALYLARCGIHVDAIDVVPQAVDELNGYARLHALPVRASVHDLRQGDPDFQGYGLFLCTYALHYLTAARAASLLAQAQTSAAPGTVHAIAAITSDGDFAVGLLAKGHFCPDRDTLCRVYADAGWAIHCNDNQRRMMLQQRHDGSAMQNLVTFVIARKPAGTDSERS
jgi:SAM-dependent methyltransferase